MTFYMIRHKATGLLMPQMKRGRGYSHWNPAVVNNAKIHAELEVPRLLKSKQQANRCISGWMALPNGKLHSYQSYEGEWDEDLYTKEDGRKKEDLEILEVEVTIKEK